MKIILACNAGMSTGILRVRMEQELKNRGVDGSVEATPVSQIEKYSDADVILLGPQVRFMEKQIAAKVNCPVFVIEMKDYGQMNAQKILSDLEAKF